MFSSGSLDVMPGLALAGAILACKRLHAAYKNGDTALKKVSLTFETIGFLGAGIWGIYVRSQRILNSDIDYKKTIVIILIMFFFLLLHVIMLAIDHYNKMMKRGALKKEIRIFWFKFAWACVLLGILLYVEVPFILAHM